MTATNYRPIVGVEEVDLFCQLPYTLNPELADDLAAGRRRPEWMWMALQGDRLVSRVAWWGSAGAHRPTMLDVFDVDEALDQPDEVGAALLKIAMDAVLPSGTRPPEFTRFVPADWRDDRATRRAVERRMATMAAAGAHFFVERLRLEWRRGTATPAPSGRLRFRTVEDRGELVGLMTEVLDGTLDAHSRTDLQHKSAQEVAAGHYDNEFAAYDSPREWWRIAELPDGRPVGFVIPAHNGYNPIIAYIGVLPAHRGQGFIDDLLAEGTRVLALQDVPRIRAATDVANVPMARAFERAGYLNFERQIDMVWH